MSPRRDPETGKFVSGGEMRSLRADMDAITGAVAFVIPAADLAGETSASIDGEDAEIIDFTGVLDDDELFKIEMLSLSLSMGLPTTSSAEGFGAAAWQLRTDFGEVPPSATADKFTGTGTADSTGIVDVAQAQSEESDIIDSGVLYAEASFADALNTLGGGSDVANEHRYLKVGADLGAVLTVDEDDELSIPTSFRTDNVNDHRISFGATLTVYGNEVRG